MSSVHIYPPTRGTDHPGNPLPQLIKTPSGLALLELQGTINLPPTENDEQLVTEIPVGKIVFPDYHPDTQEEGSTAWMKQVYLYVGQHQRLTGEVKKLPKSIAIIRRRGDGAHAGSSEAEELEIVEIVKHKIVFSNRPEPVGTAPT